MSCLEFWSVDLFWSKTESKFVSINHINQFMLILTYVEKWEVEEDIAVYLLYYFGLDVGFSISSLCLSGNYLLVIFWHCSNVKLIVFVFANCIFLKKWSNRKTDWEKKALIEVIKFKNIYLVLKYLKIEYYFNRLQNEKRGGNQ